MRAGQTTEITVRKPEELWFAGLSDGFVNEDPDVTDGKQRRYPGGAADWDVIAAAMVDICAQLQAMSSEAEFANVKIPLSLAESRAEWDVIKAWLGRGEPVIGDPGGLGDGRHRLWKTWQARPEIVLPIRSSIRDLYNDFGFSADIARILAEAPAGVWVRNPRMRAWFEIHAADDPAMHQSPKFQP